MTWIVLLVVAALVLGGLAYVAAWRKEMNAFGRPLPDPVVALGGLMVVVALIWLIVDLVNEPSDLLGQSWLVNLFLALCVLAWGAYLVAWRSKVTILGRHFPEPLSATGIFLVLLVLVWLGINLKKEPYDFLEIFLIGITVGAIYALVALGYTLVYGILELINFAHGDVFMLGAMMAATVLSGHIFGVHFFNLKGGEGAATWLPAVLVALLISMAFCGGLNTSIEFLAYRPLRGAPRLAPLITAIGMSFILQNIGLKWKGPNYVAVPSILPKSDVFSVGTADYQWRKLIVLMVTVPVLLILIWLVQKTRQGKAMRATAQDPDAAAMMGINVNRTISFTFLIAGSLAGAAGLLYALYVTNVRFDQGFQLGLIAFTAAVLGGIGNLPGAVLGATVIGLIQAFNEGLGWKAPGSDWTQSIVFSILILILVFRPEGLLGERTPEGG